jgi:hypothetical protein
MLDMLRQPSRLGRIPPAPDASRRDIAALQRGEARLVSCYLRNPPGSGWRGRWPRQGQGTLELSATQVSWRPFLGLGRRARVLDIGGVTQVRPADWSDQRFGVPGNPHLFSLVRCAAPDGRLDLLVPTADLPLVTWRLGGGEVPPGHGAAWAGQGGRAGAASRRPPPGGREIRRLSLLGGSTVLLAVALIAIGLGRLAVVLMNFGVLLLMMSILSGFQSRRYRRSARKRSGSKGA